MSLYDISDLKRFRSWARRVEEITVESGTLLSAHYKNDGSLVTIVDEKVEDFLAESISEHYPEHSILGEERGLRGKLLAEGSGLWIIDPIDGTEVYYSKLPTYANSIALYHGEECHYAAINLPGTKQRFEYWQGTVLLENQPIDEISVFHNNIMASSHYSKHFNIPESTKVRALGSICFHGCSLLLGHCKAVLVNKASIWDLAALKPMLTTNGFIIANKNGEELKISMTPESTSISSPFFITHESHFEELLLDL